MKRKEVSRKDLKIDFRMLAIAAILIIIGLMFKKIFILVLLIALSVSLSFIMNNFPIRSIGIELATFTGVVVGRVYGPLYGLLMAGGLVTYHLIASGYMGLYVLWVIPSYALGGFLAGIFTKGSIITTGIYISVLINGIETLFTALRSPGNLPSFLTYAITNVFFNVFIFTVFGNLAVFLLS